MGTDIQIYAEVRKAGKWELAEPLEKIELWSDGFEMGIEWKPRELYSIRCRALFAILANVSNPMHAVRPFEFISEPRGIPGDLSKELIDWYSRWKDDAFAGSWLLLEELLAFDWNGKRNQRRGLVDKTVAHLFKPGGGFPPHTEWPGGTIGIANQGFSPDLAEVTWIDTYAEAAGPEFMVHAMNKLRSYGPGRDVRIVFWFDA